MTSPLSNSEDFQIVEVKSSILNSDKLPIDDAPVDLPVNDMKPEPSTQSIEAPVSNTRNPQVELPLESVYTSAQYASPSVAIEEPRPFFPHTTPSNQNSPKSELNTGDEASPPDTLANDRDLHPNLTLSQQLTLLKQIHRGEAPASIDNITRAFNQKVLVKAAIARQRKQVDTILDTTSTEELELQEQIARREFQIDRLKQTQFSATPGLPELSIEKLRPIVEGLSKFRLHDPPTMIYEECYETIWELIQSAARNERLTVSPKSPIVKYLEIERLISVIRNEKATEIDIV